MALRDNLKRLRTEAGLTGKEMAERLGMNYASYMTYETPDKKKSHWPTEETLIRIASILHISIDELLGYHVDEYYSCVRYIENDCDLCFDDLGGIYLINMGVGHIYKTFKSKKDFINFVSASRKNFLESSLYIDSARTSLLADIAKDNGKKRLKEIESALKNKHSSKGGTTVKTDDILAALRRLYIDRAMDSLEESTDESSDESVHEKSAEADDSDQGAKKD